MIKIRNLIWQLSILVIPAKAGIQDILKIKLDSRFRGNDKGERGNDKGESRNYNSRIAIISFFIILFSTQNLHARPIISGISANEINIDTKFTGAEILLFGAKGDAGNILVTIRGPKKNYILSKKDKFLGVWYNKERLKFKDAYSYYAFFSSNDNQELNDILLSRLEIGEDNINFDVSGKNRDQDQFKIQFIDKLKEKDLYLEKPKPIEFMDETLFKVMLQFPKNISQGIYIVEIYLVDENSLVASQIIPIYVHQVGLSAKINQFAYNNSILYGIVAVLMAVVSGWLANIIFTKLFGR